MKKQALGSTTESDSRYVACAVFEKWSATSLSNRWVGVVGGDELKMKATRLSKEAVALSICVGSFFFSEAVQWVTGLNCLR